MLVRQQSNSSVRWVQDYHAGDTVDKAKASIATYPLEKNPQANVSPWHYASLFAEFVCDDASSFMVELAKQKTAIDVVVVDPPRKGCSKELLGAVNTLNPRKLVYISCDVATQARDIAFLSEYGYCVEYCQPVDMFPHTLHIENVVQLKLRK